MIRLAAFVASLALAGCQTNADRTAHFERIDGRKLADHPELAKQAEQDYAICRGEGAKAALSAGTIHYSGVAGSIMADQVRASNTDKVTMVMEGCFASRGYRRVRP